MVDRKEGRKPEAGAITYWLYNKNDRLWIAASAGMTDFLTAIAHPYLI